MHKYYRILEVDHSASLAEIKKAYYDLSKKYHPDLNDSPEAHQKFIEINEAYEILIRLKSLLSRPYTAKQVTKKWVQKQQKTVRKSPKKKPEQKPSKKAVTREIKFKMFRKDVFKIIRAYLYIILFFGGLVFLAYLSRTKDNDLSLSEVYTGLIFFSGLTSVVFVGIIYHFYMHYFRD